MKEKIKEGTFKKSSQNEKNEIRYICHISSIGGEKKKVIELFAKNEEEAMKLIGKGLPHNWGIDYCEPKAQTHTSAVMRQQIRKIKFEKDYPKLQGLEKVKLIQILVVEFKDLETIFLTYDATQSDGKYYQFNFKPFQKVILLVFAEPKTYKMFMTVRRWTKSKYDYYEDSISEWFKIVRGS